jgi:hypothetical protein
MSVRVKLTKHFGVNVIGETIEVDAATAEHVLKHEGGQHAMRSVQRRGPLRRAPRIDPPARPTPARLCSNGPNARGLVQKSDGIPERDGPS